MELNIEAGVHAKSLTAPRVTPADIEANIASEHYFTAYDALVPLGSSSKYADSDDKTAHRSHDALRLLTFCVLVLRNGFAVTGESVCDNPEKFNPEIGRKNARRSATSKVRSMMGYALKQKLHDAS